MRKQLKYLAPCALALLAVLAGGCGGGGSAPAITSNASRGTAAVTLQFAARPASRSASKAKAAPGSGITRAFGGNIPFGALSVKVIVTNPTTGAALAPPRIVTAPTDVNGLKPLITIQYAALPVGPVQVDVAAYPNDNATGNVLATGSASGRIAAQQTTTLSTPMVLTVKTVTVSPPRLSLQSDGDSATLVAKALDANNQPLDLPLQYISGDPDIADVAAVSGDPTMAVITSGQIRGNTLITVYEPNSGLSATVAVTVFVQ